MRKKKPARDIERAIAQADRTYQRAVRRYRRAAQTLYDPRTVRAMRAVRESGRQVAGAVAVLAQAVCRRLGLETDRDAGSLCSLLHPLGLLDPDTSDAGPRMPEHVFERVPAKRKLDEAIVGEGRLLLDAFAHVGRLDLESEDGRRLIALVRAQYAYLLPDEKRPDLETARRPTPRPARAPLAVFDPTTRRAFARADRLLARAERLGRDAARALCRTASQRSVERAERAAELVDQAMRIAAEPVLRRLGVQQTMDLYPQTFVDEQSSRAVGDLRHGLGSGRYTFCEILGIPSRSYFRSELVDRPREAMRLLARVAALPEGTAELRALRATVRRASPTKRRGRSSSK